MALKSPLAAEESVAPWIASDRRRFLAFQRTLPADGTIAFLREHHMSAPFDRDALDQLRSFCDGGDREDDAFLDRKLERKRRQLLRRCRKFLHYVGEYTDHAQDSQVSVPLIWEEEAPRKLDHAVYLLHRLAERVVRSYEEFVDTARGRLSL
jgi:hypothetical protein